MSREVDDAVGRMLYDRLEEPSFLLLRLAGIRDRERCLRAEPLQETCVLVRKRTAALLVSQIKVSEDLLPHAQRDAEEGGHRGVRGREAGRPRIGGDVRSADRAPFADNCAE